VRATCRMCAAVQKTIILVAKPEIRLRMGDEEVNGKIILKRVEI
jgi:hypothetical protein